MQRSGYWVSFGFCISFMYLDKILYGYCRVIKSKWHKCVDCATSAVLTSLNPAWHEIHNH